MNSASAIHWEDTLANVLNDLAAMQDDLLRVLKEKRDAMIAHDAEGMARLQPQEEELCRRMDEFQARRKELIEAAAQQGLEVDSLGELAEVLEVGKPGRLRRQVKSATERMSLVQHSTLTNWVVAQRSLLHLSQLLEIIATGGRTQPTYGKDRYLPTRGALVDREA